jgi:hypothetical protein
MFLLTKPPTGYSLHRPLNARKNPPKKLFENLPKNRRIIFKDGESGTFKVLIPVEQKDIDLLQKNLPR